MSKASKLHYTNTGIVALVVLTAGFGLMPVLARFLGQGLGLFEQWYVRYAVASVVAVIVFWRQVRWNKFLHLPAREWGVLSFRILSGQVVGLGLFTLASLKTDAGIVSFIFYQQLLDEREVTGGLVILASVILMNLAIRKEDRIAEEPIGAVE